MAPSMRWKASSRPPASACHAAMFILAPIWSAFLDGAGDHAESGLAMGSDVSFPVGAASAVARPTPPPGSRPSAGRRMPAGRPGATNTVARKYCGEVDPGAASGRERAPRAGWP